MIRGLRVFELYENTFLVKLQLVAAHFLQIESAVGHDATISFKVKEPLPTLLIAVIEQRLDHIDAFALHWKLHR